MHSATIVLANREFLVFSFIGNITNHLFLLDIPL